jgi:hypothetical protein
MTVRQAFLQKLCLDFRIIRLLLHSLFPNTTRIRRTREGKLGNIETKKYTFGYRRALGREILSDGCYFSLQMVTTYEILLDNGKT